MYRNLYLRLSLWSIPCERYSGIRREQGAHLNEVGVTRGDESAPGHKACVHWALPFSLPLRLALMKDVTLLQVPNGNLMYYKFCIKQTVRHRQAHCCIASHYTALYHDGSGSWKLLYFTTWQEIWLFRLLEKFNLKPNLYGKTIEKIDIWSIHGMQVNVG